MPDIDNPLDETDLASIKDNLKQLDKVDLLIGKAERAGFDMTAQKKDSAAKRAQLTQIKQSFFGNK